MTRQTVLTLLTLWTLVVLTVSLGALTFVGDSEQHGPARADTDAGTSSTLGELPAAGQLRVSGLLGAMDLTARPASPLALPLTFEPAESGSGNGAEIQGAIVGGSTATIEWTAGRPLVLAGVGLSPDPARFVLTDGSLRIEVGGVVAGFEAGSYRIDAPVAVGREGLAQPSDSVEFEVTDPAAATIEFRGNVTTSLSPTTVDLVGPGGGTLGGSFAVTHPDGSQSDASHLSLTDGTSFEVKISAVEGGYLIDAIVQGDVNVS